MTPFLYKVNFYEIVFYLKYSEFIQENVNSYDSDKGSIETEAMLDL